MNWQSIAAALPDPLERAIASPMFWALVAGGIGLWLLLPTRVRFGKAVGSVLIAVAGGIAAYDLPLLGGWADQGVFWLLAVVTMGAALATIASHSPVYSAVWFALSLLGTAGLFLFQGAQFLAVATVVVYAGAIVVTFLFVIMLAQPEGHSPYDRLTWGGLPKVLAVTTAAALVGILTFMLGRLDARALNKGLGSESRVRVTETEPAIVVKPAPRRRLSGAILDDKHVANLGRRLFSEHLVSVEVAGTMLLVALVGAIAIAMRGRVSSADARQRLGERIEEALR
jgi:NADH-quinone oxidoreductase subunit J